MRRQAKLLGDQREAKLLRPLWTFDGPRLTVDLNCAAVGMHDPHQRHHQRAFSRSVFAADAMNFASANRKRDPTKSFDIAEALREFMNGEHEPKPR